MWNTLAAEIAIVRHVAVSRVPATLQEAVEVAIVVVAFRAEVHILEMVAALVPVAVLEDDEVEFKGN